MKKVLVFALIAVFALSLSSCGKKKEKTNTEKLSIEKGWVLSAATSSPSYHMADGSYCTDLMTEGYLYDYELDDILKFESNGNMKINGGSKVPADGSDYQSGDHGVGTWKFNSDETKLTFQIPFFYDDVQETADILELSETQLRVKYTFNATNNPAKEAYSFTLTYVPAK
ncbi:MAG: hypothetical protein J6X16_07000 [Bacteroidales bacterium]|nr:hypothetical protein [Bacteroidales bacterium]